jgi:ubiquinol-cytochrome c reductase cytochrome c1 subunit
MHTMIQRFLVLVVLACSAAVHAAGGGIPWDKFPTEKLEDDAALQHGAKLFVNHCLGCHSAAYMRYNRLQDIGLTPNQIKDNLLFATDKVGEVMKASIDPKQAKEWFGAAPPDLSVIARSRSAAGQGSGADYLYTLLRAYYRDDSKPTGWNNLAYPAIAMPHPLWDKQGARTLKIDQIVEMKKDGQHAGWEAVKTVHAADGSALETRAPVADYHGHGAFAYEFAPADATREAQYTQDVADLVAYLHWMGDPSAKTRVKIGVWVLLFLFVFTVIAWRLNAAYWKDVK